MLAIFFGLLFAVNAVHEAELVNTCGPDEFPCNDGSCVDKIKWCDSKEDCADDSDENYCLLKSPLRSNPNRCNETIFFLCEDGQCIPAIGRCDGLSSCYDNSDEENCGPSENVSDALTTFTMRSLKAEESPLPLNVKDLEISRGTNDHESSMQADHMPHAEVATDKSVVHSVGESNTLENSSNLISKHLIHETKLNLSKEFNVSQDVTNKDFGILVSTSHQKPLEFRDLSGGMLHIPRNESAVTTVRSLVASTVLEKSILEHKDTSKENPEVSKRINESDNALSHVKVESGNSSRKDLDLHKGYVKLQTRDFRKLKERALHWLIDIRDKDYGWGEETARALVTLWMAGYPVEKSSDMTALTSKQLHLKLFTLMSRNETKRIPLGDLALHINALSASCDNPRNFHGHDLINILRYRTNAAQDSAKFVAPFVYLVLCLNGETSYMDVMKIRDMIHDSNVTKTDTEAVISLTATCISRIPAFSTTGIEREAARKLLNKISSKGLPSNIYEIALLTQALNEGRINQHLWNRSEAMHRISQLQEANGSFGDILSTYYAVPTLCGQSFLSVGRNCPLKYVGLSPVEVLKNGKNEKIYVHYSLRFGNPLELSQSLMIKVQKNTSFMDIMRIAATVNAAYKFKYDMNEGKPTVYSIGGIANDAERGLYWSPYISRNSTKELASFEGDIRSYFPVTGEHVAFWRKSLF